MEETTPPDCQDGDYCYKCKTNFTLESSKHHCRNCENIFCARCSSKQMPIPKLSIDDSVRVCDDCYEKLSDPNHPEVSTSPAHSDSSEKNRSGSRSTSTSSSSSKSDSMQAANTSVLSEQDLIEEDDKVVDEEEEDKPSDEDDEDKPADEEEGDKPADEEEEEKPGDEEDEDKQADEEEEEKPGDGEEEEDDDDDRRRPPYKNDIVYDFDVMMKKKKEENLRKRRYKNDDIIDDSDDVISRMLDQMRDAVIADNEANMKKIAAINKLKLLPFVINQLKKVGLRSALIDSDVLSSITEWLAPLPDRSLPHLRIRESLLKILIDFNLYDVDKIRTSGIGKAVMYLYKHPKETKENKQRAKQLISSWSRPIFQLETNFSSISREEREQRDLELMTKQRRHSKGQESSDGEGPSGSGHSSKRMREETRPVAQKPGDKGWIPRARVPTPSMRDYVIRPRSKVDADIGKSSRRPVNMLEKYLKTQQNKRRANKQQRAVSMNIDR